MLPPISAITNVEMIRDGGSLVAGFLGANGSRYCLHFALISEHSPSGDFVRLGYEQPIVFERLTFRDEGGNRWEPVNQVEVSWAHAIALLHQLRPLVRDDHDIAWLTTMEDVASSQGDIPGNMPRVLEVWRPAK